MKICWSVPMILVVSAYDLLVSADDFGGLCCVYWRLQYRPELAVTKLSRTRLSKLCWAWWMMWMDVLLQLGVPDQLDDYAASQFLVRR
jgi:hypothetical protein